MAPSAMLTTAKALLCSSLLLPSFQGQVAASRQQDDATNGRPHEHGTTTETDTEETAQPERTYRKAFSGGQEPYSPSKGLARTTLDGIVRIGDWKAETRARYNVGSTATKRVMGIRRDRVCTNASALPLSPTFVEDFAVRARKREMAPTAVLTTANSLLGSSLLLPSFQGQVAASRQDDATNGRPHEHGTTAETDTEETAESEWTYRKATISGQEPYSPSDWNISYTDCGGDAQSPINLSATVGSRAEASEFNLELFGAECSSDHLSFDATAYEWEIDFSECSDVSQLHFDGGNYSLLQMHLHSPSEHMIGGSLHDAEIHLVHSRDDTEVADSELLVVAILLDTNEYGWNVALEPLWEVLGSGATTADVHFSLNPYDLLPANMQYSHYMGSLTTPPCSEIVKWVVMSELVVIGKLQLATCRDSVATHEDSKVDERSNTNRPTQAVNGRTVYVV